MLLAAVREALGSCIYLCEVTLQAVRVWISPVVPAVPVAPGIDIGTQTADPPADQIPVPRADGEALSQVDLRARRREALRRFIDI